MFVGVLLKPTVGLPQLADNVFDGHFTLEGLPIRVQRDILDLAVGSAEKRQTLRPPNRGVPLASCLWQTLVRPSRCT